MNENALHYGVYPSPITHRGVSLGQIMQTGSTQLSFPYLTGGAGGALQTITMPDGTVVQVPVDTTGSNSGIDLSFPYASTGGTPSSTPSGPGTGTVIAGSTLGLLIVGGAVLLMMMSRGPRR